MKLADQIRTYVADELIAPARAAGERRLTIRAGDVHGALDLQNRMPAVCGALDAQKLYEQAGVRLVARRGPKHGSTAEWELDLYSPSISLRNEIWALADAFRLPGDQFQRVLLEVLAAKNVAERRDTNLDEALDILAQELEVQLLVAKPEHEQLKRELGAQVLAWELPGTPERLEAAAALLELSAPKRQESGFIQYPEWLIDPLRFLAQEAYALLFVDFGSSLLPASMLALMDRPAFAVLESSREAAEQARLLMALREVELAEIAASIDVLPAGDEEQRPFSRLEGDVYGGVYLDLIARLNRPRRYRHLVDDLAQFLVERLAPDGRAALLVPPAFLFGERWRPLRERLVPELHLEAVVDLGQPVWSHISMAPVLLVLRRPWQPLTQRVTAFAPDFGEGEPPSAQTLIGRLVPWLRKSQGERKGPPPPPAGLFSRPSAEVKGRWAPKFNSPARQQLQDSLVNNPDVNWLEGIVDLIARGSSPSLLQPYLETRLAGVSFAERQETITGLRVGDRLWLRREPENPHDPNAVHVERRSGISLGYLPAELAAEIAEDLDRLSGRYPATVTELRAETEEHPVQGVSIRFAPPQHAGDGEAVAVVRPRDIVNNQLAGEGEPAWLLAADREGVVHLEPGDILFNLYDFSQACVVPTSSEGAICHQALAVLRPVEGVDPLYLLSFILGSEFQQQLEFVARGDGFRQVAPADLKELFVIVPPLADQRRIAWAFAQSQGQLGPERSSGVEKSLDLARDTSVASGRWLASSLLSNLFGDWDQIHSLDDWLRLKGDYVRQVRNALGHGVSSFEDPALNRSLLALDDLRRAIDHFYRQAEPSYEQRQEVASTLVALIEHTPWIESRFTRQRFQHMVTQLDEMFNREPVALPVRVTLATETVASDRPALLQLEVSNVSAEALAGLVVRPSLSSGEIVEQPLWQLPRLAPGESHVFEARVRFTVAGGVEVSGEISYVELESGEPYDLAFRPLRLEVVPLAELPFARIEPNPYITGSPVESTEMFFGREEVLGFLRHSLIGAYQSNVIVLQGNRRTGKSSILKQIVVRDWFAPHIPVYIDCQGLGTLTGKLFFYKVAKEIWKTLAGRNDVERPSMVQRDAISEEDPFYDFREVLEEMLPSGRRLILLIDEFEVIDMEIQSGNLDPMTLEQLRHLFQHHRSIAAILTGSYRLSRLREEYWNALFGLGQKRQIGFLEEEATRRLIREPLADLVTYAPEAVDLIITLTACQPLYVQMVCHNVVEHLNNVQSNYVTASIVQEAAAETLVSAGEQLGDMFAKAGSPVRQALLVHMASHLGHPGETLPLHQLQAFIDDHNLQLEDDDLTIALRAMSERDLVAIAGTPGRRQYGFKIDLVRQWLRRNQDPQGAIVRAQNSPYVRGE